MVNNNIAEKQPCKQAKVEESKSKDLKWEEECYQHGCSDVLSHACTPRSPQETTRH